MREGGTDGGKTISGLLFEKEVSFQDALVKIDGYEIKDEHNILYNWNKVAEVYRKRNLYKKFFAPRGVDYEKFISKRLEPDNAIYVISNGTFFIVEIKFQKTSGSVDEKLQTCDFKKKQYQRLFHPLWLKIEFCYVLSERFKKVEYNDVLNYIQAVGCKYFFGELPLDYLGLPFPA